MLIGRLGFTAAERAGLLETEAFQPVNLDQEQGPTASASAKRATPSAAVS
ncbi:MAG: hypothetical protein R2849_03760 [Thermomicrobiales bacterium]